VPEDMNGWLRDNLMQEKYDPTPNEYTFPKSKFPNPIIYESLLWGTGEEIQRGAGLTQR
jgi:hypothetical protein